MNPYVALEQHFKLFYSVSTLFSCLEGRDFISKVFVLDSPQRFANQTIVKTCKIRYCIWNFWLLRNCKHTYFFECTYSRVIQTSPLIRHQIQYNFLNVFFSRDSEKQISKCWFLSRSKELTCRMHNPRVQAELGSSSPQACILNAKLVLKPVSVVSCLELQETGMVLYFKDNFADTS